VLSLRRHARRHCPAEPGHRLRCLHRRDRRPGLRRQPVLPDWPDSVTPDLFPSTFLQFQPTTASGQRYPQIQFVTDNSATQLETNCDVITGANCVLPPPGPGNFYPYWTFAKVGSSCVWEFGNMRNGNTFGRDAQYGSVGPDTLGAFAGPIRSNPNC
jgi:hypothetical protein